MVIAVKTINAKACFQARLLNKNISHVIFAVGNIYFVIGTKYFLSNEIVHCS